MSASSRLGGIRHVLDTRTKVTRGPDTGKHSGANADTVIKVIEEMGNVLTELESAKSELQGLLDSLDDHITQDEVYSAIKDIKEAL